MVMFCDSEDQNISVYDTYFTPYAEPSPTLINQVGSNKFPEVFRVKQGSYADHPSAKISELMKSTSLDVSSPVLFFHPLQRFTQFTFFLHH